ncbi:MAG: hypothetical protein ACP5T1_01705, partial [Thermoplasmata archaeon]
GMCSFIQFVRHSYDNDSYTINNSLAFSPHMLNIKKSFFIEVLIIFKEKINNVIINYLLCEL